MRPELSEYTPIYSGKVRELYEIDGEHLLLVASDRISAYDYILDTPIPDKGRVLTAMSVFFFDALGVPNHLAGPADHRGPTAHHGAEYGTGDPSGGGHLRHQRDRANSGTNRRRGRGTAGVTVS